MSRFSLKRSQGFGAVQIFAPASRGD